MKFKLKYPLLRTKDNLFQFLFILPLCFVSLTGHAQAKDSVSISSLIKKSSFTYSGGVFQGKGWDILQNEIQKVQFVLIGEQHGEAEIPICTEKVASIFKPAAFVAEVDPYTALQIKKVAKNPAGDAQHFKKWPYDLSFFSWETELQLARKLQADGVDIWGLNEVTFLSTGRFFETLSTVAKLPANKALAKRKAVEYGEHDRLLYNDMKQWENTSFYQMNVPYIDSLLFVFRNDNEQSKRMLRDLKASRPMLGGNYGLRIEMMKKNFLNYVAPYIGKDSISIPKLLFKFGANHLTRTNDLKGTFEVGNLADNLAAAGGKKTLHILIFGKKGSYNTMISPDNSKAIQPYNVETDVDLSMFKPFYSQLNDQEWAVCDLRSIRRALLQGKLTGSNPDLNDFLKGYDMLVMFSPVTGNKFIE